MMNFTVTFVVVLSLALKLKAEKKSSKYIAKLRKGESLPKPAILSQHEVSSPSECSLRCLRTQTCLGFNFKTTTSPEMNCQLSNNTDTSNITVSHDGGKWTFYQDLAFHDPKYCERSQSVFQIYNLFHDVCVSVNNDDVIATECQHDDVTQWWMWTRCNQLKHQNSGKCLDVNGEITSWTKLHVSPCDRHVSGQQWYCHYNFLQVRGTDLNMNYGHNKPDVTLSDFNGHYGHWRMLNSTDNVCSGKL